MTYATLADRAAIMAEKPWEDRNQPKTMYELLHRTTTAHGGRPAVTFQMFSDPDAPAETLSWSELHDQTCRTANLFRSLGVGENDVVAYLMPNSTETVLTYLGGQIAGIVNPINPLLDPEHIGGILRETGAKVLVTLKAFPKTDIAQKAAEAVKLAPEIPDSSTPVSMITRPVIVHTTKVSINVPSIAISPCSTGSLVRAAACAIGALPKPASLEKMPRATPKRIAAQTLAPAKPPAAEAP